MVASHRPRPASMAELSLLLLFLLQAIVPAASFCSVNFGGGCGSSGRSATSNITFQVVDDTAEAGVQPEYNTTVIYHWGTEDQSLGSRKYTTGERYELVETHQYEQGGQYVVGYTVTFGEGSGVGCEGETFQGYFAVTFDDATKSCVYSKTLAPSRSPTDSPTVRPTPLPSKQPTLPPSPPPTTSSPSKKPTVAPTTASPSKQPTNPPIPVPIVTETPTDPPLPVPIRTLSPTPKRPVDNTDSTDVGLNFDSCGNGICADDEHSENCPIDCTGLLLSAELEEANDAAAKGTMFSVMPWRDIIVRSIDIYSEEVDLERVEMFTKVGGYDGYESDSSAWKVVYNNYQSLQGPNKSTRLSLNNGEGVMIPANTKWSFFIYSDSGITAKDGTFEGNVLASDNILEIYQGMQVDEKWTADVDNVLAFRGAFRYDAVDISSIPTAAPPTNEPTPIQGSEQTLSPVGSNTRPTTPSPMAPSSPTPSGNTPAPVASGRPTSPTDDPASLVYSTMILYNSDVLDEDSEIRWRSVTEDTIHKEVVAATGIESKIVRVDMVDQNTLSNRRRSVRRLQSSTPLEIEFTTTIELPSNENDWDQNEMVAAGFETTEKQQAYIDALKATDDSYFKNLESMGMGIRVDGAWVAVEDFHEVGHDPDSGGGSGDNTQWYIIAGVAVGAIAVGAVAGGYYAKRRKKRKEKAAYPTTQVEVDKSGMEIETKPETIHNQTSDSLCFGVIESKEGEMDDVSTIGDPYMGDAVNAVMDTDNTVGESMVSSQQELYVYGVRKTFGGDASRVGGSTINSGSKGFIFGDDPTLEDIYQTASTGEEETSFQRITVVAPAGKLGIVIDNPHGDLPLVYAIKETSALHGKVRVGDLLISVDEVDCRGMSAHNISAFLSSRSQNPTRRLVLARGSGLNTAVTVSDV